MKKLKSSPNKKEKPKIARAFWNVNFISSAARSFKNSKISAFSDTWRARQLFSGCTAHAKICLLKLIKMVYCLLNGGKIQGKRLLSLM